MTSSPRLKSRIPNPENFTIWKKPPRLPDNLPSSSDESRDFFLIVLFVQSILNIYRPSVVGFMYFTIYVPLFLLY